MKKLLFTIVAATFFCSAQAQTARIQAIHNSADMAANTVDVWITSPAGSSLLIDDFVFRTASPFVDAPAGVAISLGIAPSNSTSIGDVLPGLTFNYNLTANETYILVAEGIVSAAGYSPDATVAGFDIKVYGMGREAATTFGNTDVLVHHGSTDAPTVDVDERTAGNVVDNAAYGDFAGYLELATADYILDVKDEAGATTVASFTADLSAKSLTDQAIVVVASGFLDPSVNSNGPAFGLWVALPAGGALVELSSAPAPTARVQVIHNSADAAAGEVDVYLDGTLLIDDFAFRTASAFIDAPAENPIQIAIAPKNSSSLADSIPGAVFNYNLGANGTYVIVADGIVSATGYSPDATAVGFDLKVYGMGREAATTVGNTDVLVHHGSTDAPTVDVDEVTAGNLVNDISYGEFSNYLELTTADYQLEVKDAAGTNTVASYDAPLSTLNLTDQAIVVVASGFLDPSMNSNGSAFGLWVALPAGGALVELPVSVPSSIGENNRLKLNIYPNPVAEILTVEGALLYSSDIAIYDISGKSVQKSSYSITNNGINISALAKGSYHLVIRNGVNLIGNSNFIKF